MNYLETILMGYYELICHPYVSLTINVIGDKDYKDDKDDKEGA